MPKPGYFSSIEALNRWYYSVEDKPATIALKSDNEKGKTLLRVNAADKKLAWETIERTLNDYGSGLFWIELGMGTGSGFANRETGLDLSTGSSPVSNANVGIAGVPAGMDMASYRKLMTYELKEELGIQAAKQNTGLIGAIADSLKSDPGVGKEIVSGLKDLAQGLMGLAMSFVMPNQSNNQNPNQSQSGEGVAIAGIGGKRARLKTKHYTKTGEDIIDCECFTIENRGESDVLLNGVLFPSGGRISTPYMQGVPYYQKMSLVGENMNVLFFYTEAA